MEYNIHQYCVYIKDRKNALKIFAIFFYSVGLLGLVIPCTFPLFLKLIPFALILSFVALALSHKSKIDTKTISIFFFIYIFAFIAEALGVGTGQIFGHYEYGLGLGIKFLQTPLIIGINWLFLVYTTASITQKLKVPDILKILIASVGMLLYDIVLEQVADKLDMWHWKDGIIPFQNYLAWYVLAVFFHALLKIFRIKIENTFAILILLCQFIFFLFLYISFKLLI